MTQGNEVTAFMCLIDTMEIAEGHHTMCNNKVNHVGIVQTRIYRKM